MPFVTIHDAATGENRSFQLDASFGCAKTRSVRVDSVGNWRGQSPLSVARCVWVVRWNRARADRPADWQEAKYRLYVNAETRKAALRRKGYRSAEVTPCDKDGLHEVHD